MPSSILNSDDGVISGTSGLKSSGGDDGVLVFQNNGTTQASVTAAGLFQFNSGYGSVATAYGCRAWVNFNGTGTPAIRASGNVSSITDNGTGDYTVNFTTAMPDANYAGILGPQAINAFGADNSFTWYAGDQITTSMRVAVETIAGGYTPIDAPNVTVSIFR